MVQTDSWKNYLLMDCCPTGSEKLCKRRKQATPIWGFKNHQMHKHIGLHTSFSIRESIDPPSTKHTPQWEVAIWKFRGNGLLLELSTLKCRHKYCLRKGKRGCSLWKSKHHLSGGQGRQAHYPHVGSVKRSAIIREIAPAVHRGSC